VVLSYDSWSRCDRANGSSAVFPSVIESPELPALNIENFFVLQSLAATLLPPLCHVVELRAARTRGDPSAVVVFFVVFLPLFVFRPIEFLDHCHSFHDHAPDVFGFAAVVVECCEELCCPLTF
jgi:hypothetical protein